MELVAVVPSLEGPLMLNIREVVIPFEFSDAGDPLRAQRQESEEAEGSRDGSADAADSLIAQRGRRWNEIELVDPGIGCGWHDARKISRIGKEGEDAREREGNPVFELETSG